MERLGIRISEDGYTHVDEQAKPINVAERTPNAFVLAIVLALPPSAPRLSAEILAACRNAVKDFRSRIREHSDDFRAFRMLTNSATIRSHAFFRVKKVLHGVALAGEDLSLSNGTEIGMRKRRKSGKSTTN
jgi:hypothetical protein